MRGELIHHSAPFLELNIATALPGGTRGLTAIMRDKSVRLSDLPFNDLSVQG